MSIKNLAVDGALKLLSLLPMKKTIIFESSPDFSCNTYPVYEYLKNSEKIKGKWRLMWFVSNEKFIPDDFPRKDVIYLEPNGIKETLKHLYCRATAAAVVMCNRVKNPVSRRQLTVFLCHGSNAKTIKGLYSIGPKIDHVLCQSHFFDKVICEQSDVTEDQLIYTGYPRCDALLHSCPRAREVFGISEKTKLIMWLPTYRKHKNQSMGQDGAEGIPLIKTKEALEELNRVLEENDVSVVLKPHPAEDLSAFKDSDTSRFRIVTDEFLAENKLRLYEVVSEADALISDYSSILYDFLLCNRPIAITTDDAEHYKNSRGFALDIVGLFKDAAAELNDPAALHAFVKDLRLGIDGREAERAKVCDLTSMFKDDLSAKRTAEFVMDKLGI